MHASVHVNSCIHKCWWHSLFTQAPQPIWMVPGVCHGCEGGPQASDPAGRTCKGQGFPVDIKYRPFQQPPQDFYYTTLSHYHTLEPDTDSHRPPSVLDQALIQISSALAQTHNQCGKGRQYGDFIWRSVQKTCSSLMAKSLTKQIPKDYTVSIVLANDVGLMY